MSKSLISTSKSKNILKKDYSLRLPDVQQVIVCSKDRKKLDHFGDHFDHVQLLVQDLQQDI